MIGRKKSMEAEEAKKYGMEEWLEEWTMEVRREGGRRFAPERRAVEAN